MQERRNGGGERGNEFGRELGGRRENGREGEKKKQEGEGIG